MIIRHDIPPVEITQFHLHWVWSNCQCAETEDRGAYWIVPWMCHQRGLDWRHSTEQTISWALQQMNCKEKNGMEGKSLRLKETSKRHEIKKKKGQSLKIIMLRDAHSILCWIKPERNQQGECCPRMGIPLRAEPWLGQVSWRGFWGAWPTFQFLDLVIVPSHDHLIIIHLTVHLS